MTSRSHDTRQGPRTVKCASGRHDLCEYCGRFHAPADHWLCRLCDPSPLDPLVDSIRAHKVAARAKGRQK